MTTSEAVQAWLAIHRELVDAETAFTDLAIRAANGDLRAEELGRHRADLIDLRERCAEAYSRAFPRAQPA